MKMDCNMTDGSASVSENQGGSWSHCWDNDNSSISGLNIEHSNELQQLVEDKDIAARAVAFVVNSSRKGIVPLCADVANLLRSKKHLESKVLHLKSENASLRGSGASSLRTSHSTSPPPSIHSYSDRGPEHLHMHERSRPSSQCSSQSSSLLSNSPKFLHKRSPRLHRTSAFTVHKPNKNVSQSPQVTMATVHASSRLPNGMQTDMIAHSSPNEEVPHFREHQRKNSLPEIVCTPQRPVTKVNPQAKKEHKEVQCEPIPDTPALDVTLEEQFREVVQLNSHLSEDLGAAKKEIDILKGRLKELQMNHLARHYMEKFYVENEFDTPPGRNSQNHPGTKLEELATKTRKSPVMGPTPLEGCKCTSCETSGINADSAENLSNSAGAPCDRQISQRLLSMDIGARVVVKGERTGCIKYVGHLEGVGQPNAVFIGLELDAPVGRHDGCVNGKRYYTCEQDHGIFIPLQDVLCVISKKDCKTEGRRRSRSRSRTPSGGKGQNQNVSKIYSSSQGNLQLPRDLDDTQGELV